MNTKSKIKINNKLTEQIYYLLMKKKYFIRGKIVQTFTFIGYLKVNTYSFLLFQMVSVFDLNFIKNKLQRFSFT